MNQSELNEDLKSCITTDYNGISSIYNKYYDFEIWDINQYTTEEINALFLEQKDYIDKIKKINKDLQRYISTGDDGISSIHNSEFKLQDISKYDPEQINTLYLEQKSLLNYYLDGGLYKEYILAIPESARVSTFHSFTSKKNLDERKIWNISDKEYWEFLKFLWLKHSKDISNCRNVWYELFRSSRKDREFFMSESDRAFFNSLPERFIVYRGYIKNKPTDKMDPQNLQFWIGSDNFGVMGFSYTLSKEVGLRYFKKYEIYNSENLPPYNYYKSENELFEGEVQKKDVLFYVNDNNEQEILIVTQYADYIY